MMLYGLLEPDAGELARPVLRGGADSNVNLLPDLYCEDAVSPKGALGLGQLMPATASELGVDPLDPGENLIGSARYLRAQIDSFGRLDHALAAYNAGPGAVKRWGGVPPYDETRSYVRAVLRHYQNFKVQTHARKEVERGLGVYHRPGR